MGLQIRGGRILNSLVVLCKRAQACQKLNAFSLLIGFKGVCLANLNWEVIENCACLEERGLVIQLDVREWSCPVGHGMQLLIESNVSSTGAVDLRAVLNADLCMR